MKLHPDIGPELVEFERSANVFKVKQMYGTQGDWTATQFAIVFGGLVVGCIGIGSGLTLIALILTGHL